MYIYSHLYIIYYTSIHKYAEWPPGHLGPPQLQRTDTHLGPGRRGKCWLIPRHWWPRSGSCQSPPGSSLGPLAAGSWLWLWPGGGHGMRAGAPSWWPGGAPHGTETAGQEGDCPQYRRTQPCGPGPHPGELTALEDLGDLQGQWGAQATPSTAHHL